MNPDTATFELTTIMNPPTRKPWPLALIGVGGLLILAGIATMLLFSSIPGPDDTTAVAAREGAAGKAGFAVLLLGGFLFLIGVISGVVRSFISRSNQNG
jgi:hypothetical protein